MSNSALHILKTVGPLFGLDPKVHRVVSMDLSMAAQHPMAIGELPHLDVRLEPIDINGDGPDQYLAGDQGVDFADVFERILEDDLEFRVNGNAAKVISVEEAPRAHTHANSWRKRVQIHDNVGGCLIINLDYKAEI